MKFCHRWYRLRLVGSPSPSHYLNQWWHIVNGTFRNKLQCNLNLKKAQLASMKMHSKMSSAKYRPFCPGLNVLIHSYWRYTTKKSLSTLAQMIACCLMAPNHYLNQCWRKTSEALWHSLEVNFPENSHDIYPCYAMRLQITDFRLQPHLLGVNELSYVRQYLLYPGGVPLTFRQLSKIFFSKFVYCRNHTFNVWNHIYSDNSMLKLCTSAQSHVEIINMKFLP